MTNEEKILQRKENVRRLFRLTDEAFVQEVMDKHRGEESSMTDDIRAQYDVSDFEYDGHKWYKLKARNVEPKGQTKKILHLHGGAFVLECGVAEYMYCGYLSEKTGAEVWFPEYHLAPEYYCVQAVDMVTELYKMMLDEVSADEIAITGSSAGGGLAVSVAMNFRELGLPQPNSLILYSPCIEFTMPETEEDKQWLAILEGRDPMISYTSMPTIGKLWGRDLPEDDYRANPIACSLKNLAPMLVFAGTGEVLNLASRHLVAKAKEQGAPVRYAEKEMMNHCWILFPGVDNEDDRALVVETLLNPTSAE